MKNKNQTRTSYVDFILFTIKQTKEAVAYGIPLNHCGRNLKQVLAQYWQNKTLGIHNQNKKAMRRSKAAMGKPLRECLVEHAVPFAVIIKYLVQMKPLNGKQVKELLEKWYPLKSVNLVTKDEDLRLVKNKLRFKMPGNWDEKDIFARYKAVGIKIPQQKIST